MDPSFVFIHLQWQPMIVLISLKAVQPVLLSIWEVDLIVCGVLVTINEDVYLTNSVGVIQVTSS